MTRWNRVRRLAASGIVWLVALVAGARAEDVVATRVGEVDDDFGLVGEFQGPVLSADLQGTRSLGLQVVALGAGTYQGRLIDGGLPGNGGQGAGAVLTGTREGQRLVLRGEGDREVAIEGRLATVSNPTGRLGTILKVVRRSVYEGAPAPPGAIVLFDGQQAAAFVQPRIVDRLLQVGTELVPTYRNFHMHLEFITPYMPAARSQGRGNSGVYLHSRYEVQILDSFGLAGAFNECGSLYRQRPPDSNLCFPPLTWQTYDLTFHAPTFDMLGRKCRDARLTLLHNGVLVHNDVAIVDKTGAGKAEGPLSLPIKLQDHSCPVQFRNIWLIELP